MSITINLATIQFATGLTLGILSGFSIGYFVYLNKEGVVDED